MVANSLLNKWSLSFVKILQGKYIIDQILGFKLYTIPCGGTPAKTCEVDPQHSTPALYVEVIWNDAQSDISKNQAIVMQEATTC